MHSYGAKLISTPISKIKMEYKKKDTKNNIHVLSRAVIINKNHILLCKTLNLAINFYFLPDGHVEHGESLKSALLRELTEEVGGKCIIKRFLGCLEYNFKPDNSNICHNHEYNFIFEVASETLTINSEIPQLETHIKLVWVPFDKINSIDFRANPLKDLLPKWLSLPTNHIFQSMML